MFARTDTEESPWFVVDADDKRSARLNVIAHLLSTVPYSDVPRPELEIPHRPEASGYHRPPRETQRLVPDHAATLSR